MKIVATNITYQQEKLSHPFGFKGGYLSELWQVVAKVESEKAVGVGVGVQSVLWAEESIFSTYSEEEGNRLMYQISEKALAMLNGKEGATPIELIDGIFPALCEFANELCKRTVRETFVRNALVCVDNALWNLYAHEQNTQDIMTLIPERLRPALQEKQEKLCNVPLLSYGVGEEEIRRLLDGGVALLKIKIGNDDGGKRTKAEMLEWDKQRASFIHDIAKNYTTEYSLSGKILYYFDANGRYDSVERVQSLLDFFKQEGFLEQVVLFEEPFPEEQKIDVHSLPVRIVGDESVHSLVDVEERIALGYKAIALKPIAKTLSETLKIVNLAYEKGVHCFCADLTVNPYLVEWNKNVAARIARLPEMKIGVLESNGAQNYARWEEMEKASPAYGKSYAKAEQGVYTLNEDFYKESGRIFDSAPYYEDLV